MRLLLHLPLDVPDHALDGPAVGALGTATRPLLRILLLLPIIPVLLEDEPGNLNERFVKCLAAAVKFDSMEVHQTGFLVPRRHVSPFHGSKFKPALLVDIQRGIVIDLSVGIDLGVVDAEVLDDSMVDGVSPLPPVLPVFVPRDDEPLLLEGVGVVLRLWVPRSEHEVRM